MKHSPKSIRPFIGASNFKESRSFYNELGFKESIISKDMSYFKIDENIGFYLQDYYAKDWVDNSMIFLEVGDTKQYYEELKKLELSEKYKNVRLTPIRENVWGRESLSA
ncbi:MAG: glyoxalase [Ilyomonas sp.]